MKKLFLLLFLSTTIFSCRVTWVPAKSPSMIVNLIDIQTSIEGLYDNIVTSPDKSFSLFSQRYDVIDSKIDSIISENKQRDYAQNILTQTLLLQKYFRKYREAHHTRADITNDEFQLYKDYLKAFIKPILVSELSLK